MKPEDVRKLVGGYAMGTLTGEERRALLEAALSDQDLFNELAREQPLKDLLEDPLARRQLLNAVEETRDPAAVFTRWWRRPTTWALAGGLATAAVLVAIFVRPPATSPKPEPVLMAKREAAPVAAPVASAPQAAVETRAKVKAPASKPAESVEMAETPPTAPAPAEKPQMLAAREEAQPLMDSMRQPAAEAVPSREMKMSRTSATLGAAGGLYRADLGAQSSVVPYKLLRADASGNYTEVGAGTAFRRGDRVRVSFEPKESGRLVVASGASKTPLLDVDAARDVTMNLDVPPDESRLIVTFTPTGGASSAPFEIQIRRE